MGTSITEAAQRAGVTRQTVSEWCNHHDGFRAELATRRASALRTVNQRVCSSSLPDAAVATRPIGVEQLSYPAISHQARAIRVP